MTLGRWLQWLPLLEAILVVTLLAVGRPRPRELVKVPRTMVVRWQRAKGG